MYQSVYALLTSAALLLALSSCKSTLKSESGLYDVPLKHSYKDPVDGSWLWDGVHPYAYSKNVRIYLAPIDVSLIAKKHPTLAPLLAEQFKKRIEEQFSAFFKKHNKRNDIGWELTTNPKGAQMRLNFAVVKFTPQYPVLRTLITAGSFFSPIPGVGTVAATFVEGSIGMEATVRDTSSKQLYLAFKDSNRKPVFLYQANAYSSTGQADTNFSHWASKMASLMSQCQTDGSCYVDYQNKVNSKNWLRAAWEHLPIPEL